MHGSDLGLDVTLVHGGGVELALDNDVGLREAPCNIPQLLLAVAGDVAVLARVLAQGSGGEVLVQERSVLLHGLADVDDGAQGFVLHLDQVQRLLGDVRTGCGHGSHGVALVEHLAGG